MKRTLKLRTHEGNKISIALEHWGSGMDGTMRRWILEDGYWHCMDSAEIARKSPSGGEYAFLIAAVSAVAWGPTISWSSWSLTLAQWRERHSFIPDQHVTEH